MEDKIPEAYFHDFEKIDFMTIDEFREGYFEIELIRKLFNVNILALSEVTGFHPMNFYLRIFQIMKNLEPYENWTSESEEKHRKLLVSTGLRLRSNRKKAILAHKSLFHIISELCDLGFLRNWDLEEFEILFRKHDPQLYYIEIDERPNYINKTKISESEKTYSRIENATLVSKEDFENIHFFGSNNSIILGEDTTLVNSVDGNISEIRRSKLVFKKLAGKFPKTYNDFFEKHVSKLIEEYSKSYPMDDNCKELIIKNEFYEVFSPKTDWLALNPIIGYEMGWNVNQTGFSWTDENSERIVESVFWSDGLVEDYNLSYKNEVGQGWVVLIHESALNELIKKYGPVIQIRYISKYLNNEFPEDNEKITSK